MLSTPAVARQQESVLSQAVGDICIPFMGADLSGSQVESLYRSWGYAGYRRTEDDKTIAINRPGFSVVLYESEYRASCTIRSNIDVNVLERVVSQRSTNLRVMPANTQRLFFTGWSTGSGNSRGGYYYTESRTNSLFGVDGNGTRRNKFFDVEWERTDDGQTALVFDLWADSGF
jgi:hypothetical protein